MAKALGATIGGVIATVWGLPAWQMALLVIAAALLVVGVATFVVVLRIHTKLDGITRDQEVRIDALGRKRPERLQEG